MPTLFLYLLKMCCGLAAVYLFYWLALRNLTFYTANRLYLLLFTGFCFILPLVDVNPTIEPQQFSRTIVVQAVPVVHDYANILIPDASKSKSSSSFSPWDAALVIWLAGILLLFIRLILGHLSYRRIKKEALPFVYNGIRLYHINKSILPFSFGYSIFLNKEQHTAAELQGIIRHELVHVEQRHTIDILLAEMLCIFNWYNPFAWLLRHAIRQNLEFIADSEVVQSGSDKRAYQYLLLHVMGTAAYPIANQFSFSSLKKRIVMLNRLPSAKAHLMKFILVLPLLAILLLACRENREAIAVKDEIHQNITFSGIVVKTGTYEPLKHVLVAETLTGAAVVTDSPGFYILDVPVNRYPFAPELTYTKQGYGLFNIYPTFMCEKSKYRVVNISNMEPLGPDGKIRGLSPGMGVPTDNIDIAAQPSYEEAAAFLPATIRVWQTSLKFRALREQTTDSYLVMDGRSYVTSNGGISSVDGITDIVFADGVRMTGAEVNKKVPRADIIGVGSMPREMAKERLGIDQPVLEIYINKHPKETYRHPLL